MIVVSDTSPLNYLILIGHDAILPRLLGNVVAPLAVLDELRHEGAADSVRRWASAPPSWLGIVEPKAVDASLQLGAGENAAISLALELRASGKAVQVLMDDRDGRDVAAARDLTTIGTLAVLAEGSGHGLLDLSSAFARLRATGFYARAELLEQLLRLDRVRRGVP